MVSALCAVAEQVLTAFLWRPQLRDPADEMVLEAAINGNADALVAFSRRDFGDVPRRFGIAVLSPGQALRRDRVVKRQTCTYPLRLPASLKAAVAEISKEDGTSINQFVATAVAEKVAAMKTADSAPSGRTAVETRGPPGRGRLTSGDRPPKLPGTAGFRAYGVVAGMVES